MIVTPRVSEHRFFRFMRTLALPDNRLVAIASDSFAIFGVLESRFHRLWCLRKAAAHGVGNDPTYGIKDLFRTFPFPACILPKERTHDDPAAVRVADAARRLDTLREEWLNPSEWTAEDPADVLGDIFRVPARRPKDADCTAKLVLRTMTTLLNDFPPWLQTTQRELNEAVAGAYGWPADISDEEAVERLFDLNLKRASIDGRRKKKTIRAKTGKRKARTTNA